MGRSYGGVLGTLAFLMVSARGLLHGAAPGSVLFSAWLALLVFAVLGFGAGLIANGAVEQAVKSRVAAEMAERHTSDYVPADGSRV